MVAVLSGAALMFGTLRIYDSLNEFPPVVPWTLPALLGVLGLSGIGYGLLIPKRLKARKLTSREGVFSLATGKAMVLTGAVLAGGYAVYVLRYLALWEATSPFARVTLGSLTVLAALLLAAAGSLIEHNLIIKDPPDEMDSGHGGRAAT